MGASTENIYIPIAYWNVDGNDYIGEFPQGADIETWEPPEILGSRQLSGYKDGKNPIRDLALEDVNPQDFERSIFLALCKLRADDFLPKTILWNGM